MTSYLLEHALLPSGWAREVGIEVSDGGLIAAIRTEVSTASRERIAGFVAPGMPNAHSHAFQRAMSGDTEFARSGRDSFWTWRHAMYALANRVDPEALEVIATQLYIEMLKAGYTSVAEFHYLHRDIDAKGYAGVNLMHAAVLGAARAAGIGLTMMPALYQSSDFGDRPLEPQQRRFELSLLEWLDAIKALAQVTGDDPQARCGAAFHSLRAVGPSTIADAVSALRSIDAAIPIHIHIAEQMREVNACRRTHGKRPVELLLDADLPDGHWCLVHATHATKTELEQLAKTGACVCVCTTTEANLGDGFFDAQGFLRAGGRVAIGSDSHASVSPAEELRWIEYQQRLRRRRRAVMTSESEMHVGTRLWSEAARSGARALGQPVGELRVGARADWLVLDEEDPTLAGAAPEAALDRLIFTSAPSAIRDVMVGGQWVVRERRHEREESCAERFAAWMRESARLRITT